MYHLNPRKDPSFSPLTLTMLPVYFRNRWLGSFNNFKCSILAGKVEKSPLKSHMQRKEDSRDQTLNICFAYVCTLCIWYREETGWMATSLSRITLRTTGWSVLPPEPWPTVSFKLRAMPGISYIRTKREPNWGYPAIDHSGLPRQWFSTLADH